MGWGFFFFFILIYLLFYFNFIYIAAQVNSVTTLISVFCEIFLALCVPHGVYIFSLPAQVYSLPVQVFIIL